MVNVLYVTNTVKQADWFLQDLLSVSSGGYHNACDLYTVIKDITVWGASVNNLQLVDLRAMDYFVDDVDKMAATRDAVEKVESALYVAKMKLSEYGKVISKKELIELIKKETGVR